MEDNSINFTSLNCYISVHTDIILPDCEKVILETKTATLLKPCVQVTDPLRAIYGMEIYHSNAGVLESSDIIMTVNTLENCNIPYKFKLFQLNELRGIV